MPQSHGASLIAQLVRNAPTMRETLVWFLGWEDPLEKGKATHSSIWPGEFHGLYSHRVGLSDFHFTHPNSGRWVAPTAWRLLSPFGLSWILPVGGTFLVLSPVLGPTTVRWLLQVVIIVPGQGGPFHSVVPLTEMRLFLFNGWVMLHCIFTHLLPMYRRWHTVFVFV